MSDWEDDSPASNDYRHGNNEDNDAGGRGDEHDDGVFDNQRNGSSGRYSNRGQRSGGFGRRWDSDRNQNDDNDGFGNDAGNGLNNGEGFGYRGGRGGRGGRGVRGASRGSGGGYRGRGVRARDEAGDRDDNDDQNGFSGRRRNNDDQNGGFGGRRRNNDDQNGFGGRSRNNDDGNGNFEEDGEEKEKKQREFYIPPPPTEDEDEIFNSGISSGINFAKYDNIPVKVSGDAIPPPINSFTECGLRELLLENIQKSGYKTPTPIQKTAIPVIAAHRDLMACAQTGSGKTAAFLLPIINELIAENVSVLFGQPQVLIVSPTRELSIQIFNEARKFALGSILRISIIYGGTSSKHQGENIAKGCHILICTPGRLLDFVEKTFITFESIRYVVLDEADRMLDMGFKGNMETIMQHPSMNPDRQVVMFSATFPEDIQRLAGEFLSNYIFITIGVVGGACTDVQQKIYEVRKMQKRSKLMELLQEKPDGTIVFVETKRNADFLASLLSETDHPTTSIHGDRLQRQREQALGDFKSGRMKVLIATSVAARGLDIKNVRHVINYDMPKSIDDYVHRIGRTGRVGNNGCASSFYDPDTDSAIAADLVRILEGAGQDVPVFLLDCGGASCVDTDFGGSDVRNSARDKDGARSSAPAAYEAEEVWE